MAGFKFEWGFLVYFKLLNVILIQKLPVYGPNFCHQMIETYNTRLFKEEKDGSVTYILRLASVAMTGEYRLKSKFVMFSDSLFYENKVNWIF